MRLSRTSTNNLWSIPKNTIFDEDEAPSVLNLRLIIHEEIGCAILKKMKCDWSSRVLRNLLVLKITQSYIVLGSFENSYISENPRTPPISYISQTVIPFKKPTSGPSKTFKMITIR
ncbi:hypothetical protein LXL04_005797 [Taraxacum kok-saghyz]